MKIQVKLNNFIFKVFWEFESFFQLFLRKLKHKRTEKIRVVFIAQYIPAWNKSETVYHQMKSNTTFEVFLLCVPSEIQNCKFDLSTLNPDYVFYTRPYNNYLPYCYVPRMVVKEFRDNCERIGNLFLDETEEYIPAIWNSSVLISDISAFVVEYFVTGKPIIFCPAHTTIEFLDEIKKLYVWSTAYQKFLQIFCIMKRTVAKVDK